MTQWLAGIAQLNDSGYPFTLHESLEDFVDHLPDMDHKPTKDLVYQSLNHSNSKLPMFKSILECVLITDIHINCTCPSAIHSHPHPMSATLTPSSTVLSSTTLATTAPSNPHVAATTTSHPPRSANYCTGCKHTAI